MWHENKSVAQFRGEIEYKCVARGRFSKKYYFGGNQNLSITPHGFIATEDCLNLRIRAPDGF